MKAKVLILPDSNASFVSYLKRQRALCKYRSAKTSRKVATTMAPSDKKDGETSNVLMDVASVGDELRLESSVTGAEPSK